MCDNAYMHAITLNGGNTLYSNTPWLYSQWLNSVIYWLINNCMDWAQTGVTSFGRQFNFMTSSITIDGLTSILQLLDVQNISKNTSFSLNKSCGKFWQSAQDGGIFIDYEGFVLFVC